MITLCPISLSAANQFVALYHRHHKPLQIHKFSIGCASDDQIVGAAIVARPAARMLDDGMTLEVARLCTDGTKNACSMLYSAAWRAARAMGYRRIITYTLKSENGASLRAAGWRCSGEAGAFAWQGKRERQRNLLGFENPDAPPREKKLRYEKTTNEQTWKVKEGDEG
jgi:hypothetical protein